MTNPPLMEGIFALQEQVLRRHIDANIERFNFVSEAIEVLSDLKISPEAWETIPVEMRTLFNYFHSDAVSTTMNATRLCLQGCDTDVLALMRVVLENMTIFDYISTKRLYLDAFREIQNRSGRGKTFSDKFSYKKAIKALGITDRRDQLHGQMSTLGSHSSPPRLSLARVRHGGSYHPKVGMALDNPNIPLILGELASLTLFVVRVVCDFFKTYLDAIPKDFSERSANLEKKYEALKVDK